MKRLSFKVFGANVLFVFLLMTIQCATKPASVSELSKDVAGIGVGMSKENARKRLEEIAVFERDEEKRQQIWRLKNNARFSELAIGYDKENQVRYITMFVNEAAAKERIRFAEVGDTSRAKQEVVPPHYRYIWEVPASENAPAHFVNVYGNNPETLTMYSLSKVYQAEELKKDSEDSEESDDD